jgi:shikimate kinase
LAQKEKKKPEFRIHMIDNKGQSGGQAVLISVSWRRIILTGFRATGKSLVGCILAENMNLDFIDTDSLFTERTGLGVADYVEKYGWNAFRVEEEELLFSLSGLSGVVIATGGGAILHKRAWTALRGNNDSISIWLRAEVATIVERLGGDDSSLRQRPSLTGINFLEEVEELDRQRRPFYKDGSDMSFKTDNLSPLQLATRIEQAICLSIRRQRIETE